MPTVLVTGSNRGIGLELVRQFSDRGWTALAACRDPEGAADLRALADKSHERVRLVTMDVADQTSVAAAARSLDGMAIDVLVNSAGVYGPQSQTLADLDESVWREVLEVNTFGPMRVLKAFASNLTRGERKLTAAITSGMGSLADNTSGRSIYYRTSKAALNMATRTVAFELAAQKITCIVINPGWVRTDMGGPNGRISVEESVTGIIGVLDRVGLDDSGEFFNYNGKTYPW